MKQPSKSWRKISEVYKVFAEDWKHICDFSNEAALAMYEFESTGKGNISISNKQANDLYNGFAVGKHWMDATVKMWKEDIKNNLLYAKELYEDSQFPHWFLKRIGIVQ